MLLNGESCLWCRKAGLSSLIIKKISTKAASYSVCKAFSYFSCMTRARYPGRHVVSVRVPVVVVEDEDS